MKTLIQHINEWKLNKNDLLSRKTYHPTSYIELKNIINLIYKNTHNHRYIDCNDIDISKVDTFGDSVDGKYGLFADFTYVEIIDISSWDMSHIKDMRYMFYRCKRLRQIKGIENFDPAKITNDLCMFSGCDDSVIPDWYKNKRNTSSI